MECKGLELKPYHERQRWEEESACPSFCQSAGGGGGLEEAIGGGVGSLKYPLSSFSLTRAKQQLCLA